MCEAQERNEQAAYELRGMAQQWQLDIPRILQILAGADTCQHQTTNG